MLIQTRSNDYRFAVRLARDEGEIQSAQRLRYQVFYEEMGARPTPWMALEHRDADCFDHLSDHLLVIDTQTRDKWGDPQIAGAYRLTRRDALGRQQKFYTESEFDLRALKGFPGEILELSRSCVHPCYRNRAVLDMLWMGLGEYVTTRNIDIMFGCASFPGADPEQAADALTFLHTYHMASEELRPHAHPDQYVSMQRRYVGEIDKRQVMRQMPPLIRGYVGAGAMVGDGAVIDTVFNTVDICVVVMTNQLSRNYARRYRGAA